MFNVLGSALLAWCAPAGLAWKSNGQAGMRPEAPAHIVGDDARNEAALAIGRRNYKKAKYGMPVGWFSFVIGFALQIVALHAGS